MAETRLDVALGCPFGAHHTVHVNPPDRWDDDHWVNCEDCDFGLPFRYWQERADIADERVREARQEADIRAERLQEYFCYWLLRAYHSGHREGWEDGPSSQQTMNDLLNVLANSGFDPSGPNAAALLKKRMAYFTVEAARAAEGGE